MKFRIQTLVPQSTHSASRTPLEAIMRWGSVHVFHRASMNLDRLLETINCEARRLGFDLSQLAEIYAFVERIHRSVTPQVSEFVFSGFEFSTDGFNVGLYLLLPSQCSLHVLMNDLAMEARTSCSPIIACGDAPELGLGIVCKKLATSKAEQRSVWLLGGNSGKLAESAAIIFKEVG